MDIKICHIYPDAMNLYGDRGNITCMAQRLKWRGIGCTLTEMPVGSGEGFSDCDLFFIGGGQEFEQEVILKDFFATKAAGIRAAIDDGKTFLTVCGGYQMMGHYYQNAKGEKIDLLGAADLHTVCESRRMTGDYAFTVNTGAGETAVIAFENHPGRTYLGENAAALGKVIKGFGNNGQDGTEGVRHKNLFGTYGYGPLLPKNPALCDYILLTALERKYGSAELSPLEDNFENAAHDIMLDRLLRSK
ncbi:MAG: glutamine amidotransferase [Oscillospiraceae bacterium]|nr:glutamine amidotransferase [Oscillospiraceae bacterium]